MELTGEQLATLFMVAKIVTIFFGVFNIVLGWYAIRYFRLKIAKQVLNDRKIDALVYALKNINGSFKGWSDSFNEKYDNYFHAKEVEDKVKYYN